MRFVSSEQKSLKCARGLTADGDINANSREKLWRYENCIAAVNLKSWNFTLSLSLHVNNPVSSGIFNRRHIVFLFVTRECISKIWDFCRLMSGFCLRKDYSRSFCHFTSSALWNILYTASDYFSLSPKQWTDSWNVMNQDEKVVTPTRKWNPIMNNVVSASFRWFQSQW